MPGYYDALIAKHGPDAVSLLADVCRRQDAAIETHCALSRRDAFAAAVIAGIIELEGTYAIGNTSGIAEQATLAVAYADALIAELDKE